MVSIHPCDCRRYFGCAAAVVRILCLSDQEKRAANEQRLYRFSNQMQDFKVSNRLIKNVYIYYPGIDHIAGNLGVYRASSYYTLLQRAGGMPQGRWVQDISLYTDSRLVSIDTQSGNHFLYVRAMRYEGNNVGSILVEIDPDELIQPAGQMQKDIPGVSVLGMLLDGKLLFVSGGEQAQRSLADVAVSRMPGQGVVESGGIIAHIRGSEYAGLAYVAGYSHHTLYHPVYVAIWICGAGILFCLALGIISSMYVSRRNARPLTSILQKLDDGRPGGEDAYQYINGRIDQLLRDKFKSEEQFQQHQALVQGMFLSTILRDEPRSEYAVFNIAKQYDILFENPVYQVAVIQAKATQPDRVDAMLLGVINHCRASGLDALAAYMDGRYVVLLNLEEGWTAENGDAVVEPLLRPFGCDRMRAVVGIGQGYDNLVGIATSYVQALSVLSSDENAQGVHWYSPRALSTDAVRQRGIAAMEAFTRHAYAGRYEKAMALLDAIFTDYLSDQQEGEPSSRKMAALQSLMLDVLYKQGHAGTRLPYAVITQRLKAASHPMELRACIQRILNLLLQVDDGDVQENAGGSAAERAKAFIKLNIGDSMLGLYMISDQLGVSNTYLSSHFKQTFGVGVVQYINQLRIDQAKELILSTDMSIKDIALAVGFNSDVSFIRVFKKYEEKTPSALRKAEGGKR